jgi:hypothetical protein
MNSTEKLILFIIVSFPDRKKLTLSRIVKTLYLAEWKNCLVFKNRLTQEDWFFNYDGPYFNQFENIIRESNCLQKMIIESETGDIQEYITSTNVELKNSTNLVESEKKILLFAIENTFNLNWREFNRLVYSTYPLMKMTKFSKLNLLSLAKEYINMKNENPTDNTV